VRPRLYTVALVSGHEIVMIYKYSLSHETAKGF